jgi:hypothetical protein
MLGVGIIVWLKAKRDGYSSKTSKRRQSIGRVFAYGTVVSVAFAACGVRSARAELADKALVAGRELAAAADVAHDVKRIRMNGEVLNLGNGISTKSIKEVLDQYESFCGAEGNLFGDLKRMLDPKDDSIKLRTVAGTSRKENAEEGVVFCAHRSPDVKTSALDAVEEFATTLNLGALGQIRYVYAHKLPSGTTQVTTLWTDGSFNIQSLVPSDGKDSPGADSPYFPRPLDSRRLFAFEIEGTAYGSRVYESNASPDAVIKDFVKFSDGNGFAAIREPGANGERPAQAPGAAASATSNELAQPAESTSAEQPTHMAFLRDGVIVLVAAERHANGKTSVAVGEIGASEGSAAGTAHAKAGAPE